MLEDNVPFPITETERQILLNHASVPDSIKMKLGEPSDDKIPILYLLDPEDVETLSEIALVETEKETARSVKQAWRSLWKRVEVTLSGPDGGDDRFWEEYDNEIPSLTPEELETLRDLMGNPFLKQPRHGVSLLSAVLQKNGLRSTDNIGALPLPQFVPLVSTAWNTPGSVIKLNRHLSKEECSSAPFFGLAVTLLNLIKDLGGRVPVLMDGQISPKIIRKLLPLLPYPKREIALLRQQVKAIQEIHLMPVHKVRNVLEQAGLLRARKRELVLSRLGRRILDGEQYGRMLVKMVRSAFQDLNLAYFDEAEYEEEEFQDLIPYLLFRAAQSLNPWTPFAQAVELLLPVEFHESLLDCTDKDARELVLLRFLAPLIEFGLLEIQDPAAKLDRLMIRKTPLFDRLFYFRLPAVAASDGHPNG